MYITASKDDIYAIKKLNGWTFASAPLTIDDCDLAEVGSKGKSHVKEGLSADAQELQDKLRTYLSTRYDSSLKLLSLPALGQDPNLVSIGVFNAEKKRQIFPALMATCDKLFENRQAKKDAIISITLANNDLEDLTDVNTLTTTFPDLLNLDLSNNRIADLTSLEAWRGKLRSLENLVVAGNPLVSTVPQYELELMKWFPRLQTLNGIIVRTPQDIAAAAMHATPFALLPPDFRDVSQVGENFVRQFVTLYDNNRDGLLSQYYDAETTFSLSINTSPKSNHDASLSVAPWTAYIQHSRNMTRITHIDARMRRSYRGVTAIQKLWAELPQTRHPDIGTGAEKYIIECHPLPGLLDPSGNSPRGVDGLLINVHGEFEEAPAANSKIAQVMRSFSRTFVLGPGKAGAPPIRVVSEMLVLRAWAPLKTPWIDMNPAAVAAPNVELGHTVVDPQTLLGTESQAQLLLLQLCERTGMTPHYAELCLAESGPDLEKALLVFATNKVCEAGVGERY